MKYINRLDGEQFEVKNEEITRWACCDCGLVHDITFAIEDNGNIGVAAERNNRATAQRRRYLTKWKCSSPNPP